jgi:hypothetical protein
VQQQAPVHLGPEAAVFKVVDRGANTPEEHERERTKLLKQFLDMK